MSAGSDLGGVPGVSVGVSRLMSRLKQGSKTVAKARQQSLMGGPAQHDFCCAVKYLHTYSI